MVSNDDKLDIVFLEWDTSYSIGIDEIDNQHKELIVIINRLYEGMASSQPKENQVFLLKVLEHFITFHFKTEENIFEKIDYPATEEHKKYHKELTKKFNDIISSYIEERKELTDHWFDNIKSWLIDHVIGEDQAFGEYYANNCR